MSLIASKTFVLILKFTLIIMFVVSIDSQALQIEYKLGAENKIPKAIVGKGNVPSGIDIAYFEDVLIECRNAILLNEANAPYAR